MISVWIKMMIGKSLEYHKNTKKGICWLIHILSLPLTNHHTFSSLNSINLSSQESRQGLTGSSAQGLTRQNQFVGQTRGLIWASGFSSKLIKVVSWIQCLVDMGQKFCSCCCSFVSSWARLLSAPRTYLQVLVTSPSQNLAVFLFFKARRRISFASNLCIQSPKLESQMR